jgi:hypothetical protein
MRDAERLQRLERAGRHAAVALGASARARNDGRPQGAARRAAVWLVRFWDSSALIPLVIPEAGTTRVRRWMAEDDEVAVWTLARVELLSAPTSCVLMPSGSSSVTPSGPPMPSTSALRSWHVTVTQARWTS